MKILETELLDVKVFDDGHIKARRKDRKPLTDEDRAEARRVADTPPSAITADDVLGAFPGSKVVGRPGPPCRACGQPVPLERDEFDGRGFQNLWMHKCGRKGHKT
jgi:hypothetical protein